MLIVGKEEIAQIWADLVLGSKSKWKLMESHQNWKNTGFVAVLVIAWDENERTGGVTMTGDFWEVITEQK